MSAASGTVYTIAPGLPFVDALAAGILAQVGEDPLALSRVTVLLPTVRAVRALREAFLRLSRGRSILLPRLSPLGDVDTDEVVFTQGGADLDQAVPALRRQLLLARLVMRAPDLAATAAQATRLAAELASLLDEVQTEGCSFGDLARLVPDDYAQHWQVTLKFLEIITQHWPALLADEGGVDPAREREQRLKALAETWTAKPPPAPSSLPVPPAASPPPPTCWPWWPACPRAQWSCPAWTWSATPPPGRNWTRPIRNPD